ncbi:MAG: hypothetical protein US68_C0008G0072 [Candidatus Shapirobacteria bacterium GW2011_GWE1_38_10]|uniref:Uncharacterized protein n=1 Tax=Candidatus Shapirobacteria bacterium GW2011_GWE1_38_10 TaxID=1618488 RepID=A0A0G0I6M5_9BACT|nr:MAG: hypothetical protein US46_C0006G0073 [Candidatus Shapirobacteria bacterium GW2011_GWF2_37_20]KKQ50187.1 MAG: hypothetical protein US68_C0008G0072 [Candidatus Shapirobacteria bacterium GW2011_GWE1_38_10]KKQ63795.1 MAG: hypothetical protein US85_C0014G0027 [Candidatus Shapirobacteria bacterium GW2011_GWF1_38_23]
MYKLIVTKDTFILQAILSILKHLFLSYGRIIPKQNPKMQDINFSAIVTSHAPLTLFNLWSSKDPSAYQ